MNLTKNLVHATTENPDKKTEFKQVQVIHPQKGVPVPVDFDRYLDSLISQEGKY
jgi:hypothetical protein